MLDVLDVFIGLMILDPALKAFQIRVAVQGAPPVVVEMEAVAQGAEAAEAAHNFNSLQ